MSWPGKRSILMLSLSALVACFQAVAQQQQPQEEQPLGPEYTRQYREDYNAYQQAIGEQDLSKREDLLLKFLTERPNSKLKENALAAYRALCKEYKDKGDNQAIARAAEKYLKYDPEDLISLALVVEAYQGLGDKRKFIEYGERFYAKQPNGSTAYFLAKAYRDLNDTKNLLEWAKKTVEHDPNNLEMLLELVVRYGQQNQVEPAARYARPALKALDEAQQPAGVSAGEWNRYVNAHKAICYRALGESAYNKNSYKEAAANFQSSLKYDPRNDLAYYRLGFCYWRMNMMPAAMNAFAKAYLLKGPFAGNSRQQLEFIYKSINYGKLDGIERIYNKAKAELGLQ